VKGDDMAKPKANPYDMCRTDDWRRRNAVLDAAGPDERGRACAALNAMIDDEEFDPELLAYILIEGIRSTYFRRTARVIPLRPEP
jgi:hypothetical protein